MSRSRMRGAPKVMRPGRMAGARPQTWAVPTATMRMGTAARFRAPAPCESAARCPNSHSKSCVARKWAMQRSSRLW
eukprot:3058049-Rhodomonas_salina.1